MTFLLYGLLIVIVIVMMWYRYDYVVPIGIVAFGILYFAHDRSLVTGGNEKPKKVITSILPKKLNLLFNGKWKRDFAAFECDKMAMYQLYMYNQNYASLMIRDLSRGQIDIFKHQEGFILLHILSYGIISLIRNRLMSAITDRTLDTYLYKLDQAIEFMERNRIEYYETTDTFLVSLSPWQYYPNILKNPATQTVSTIKGDFDMIVKSAQELEKRQQATTKRIHQWYKDKESNDVLYIAVSKHTHVIVMLIVKSMRKIFLIDSDAEYILRNTNNVLNKHREDELRKRLPKQMSKFVFDTCYHEQYPIAFQSLLDDELCQTWVIYLSLLIYKNMKMDIVTLVRSLIANILNKGKDPKEVFKKQLLKIMLIEHKMHGLKYYFPYVYTAPGVNYRISFPYKKYCDIANSNQVNAYNVFAPGQLRKDFIDYINCDQEVKQLTYERHLIYDKRYNSQDAMVKPSINKKYIAEINDINKKIDAKTQEVEKKYQALLPTLNEFRQEISEKITEKYKTFCDKYLGGKYYAIDYLLA